MDHVALDAAFPPTPALWVSDMDAVGATVGFIYVYGGFTNYTPAHRTLAESMGKITLPIVVPGNSPPSYAIIWAALIGYGYARGPVIVDREPGSEPTDAWVQGLRAFLDPLGYQTDTYCSASECATFQPTDDQWLAQWIRTGVLNPIPTLAAGTNAWQFVNDVSINGRQYDVSVVNDTFISGGTDMTEDQAKALQHVSDTVGHIYNFLFYEGDQETSTPSFVTQLNGMQAQLTDLQSQVHTLESTPASPIADALAANPTFLAALAKAVVAEMGKSLQVPA